MPQNFQLDSNTCNIFFNILQFNITLRKKKDTKIVSRYIYRYLIFIFHSRSSFALLKQRIKIFYS